MSVVEGRGRIAPAPILVCLDDGDMDMIDRMGQRRADERKYEQRNDRWGRGLTSDPIRVGFIGQFAVKRWLDRQMGKEICMMDESYKPMGDGGIDLKAAGITMQVKSTAKAPDATGDMLIRRVSGTKRVQSMTADIFLYVASAGGNRPELLGWIERRKIGDVRFGQSKVADHWNIEIPRDRLKPMNRLVSKIKAALAMNGGAACR